VSFDEMLNVKMTIAYDGTCYLGWQKTHTGPSIEEALEKVLEQILQEDIFLQAASRTDAGVHAEGQVVNFITKKTNLDFGHFRHSINSMLPKDIVVGKIEIEASNFHPTLDSTGKEYHYYMCFHDTQMPYQRLYSWHYPYEVNVEAMRQAAESFIGTHDFAAFCNFKKNATYDHYVRTIQKIDIFELPEKCLRIEISGTNFLYKMVRNIVGTLAYVGNGKICVSCIPEIISNGDRTKAGVTAPAHGLFLKSVFY
jgi:tRNA pseudouridine38-40 synthase